MLYLIKQIGNFCKFHKDDIIVLLNESLEINSDEIDIEEEEVEDNLDSSCTRVDHKNPSNWRHKKPSNWREYLLLSFVNGGGGAGSSPGSPGVSPTYRYKQSLASFLIMLNIFLNNPYSTLEHALLNGLSFILDFSLNFISFYINNYGYIYIIVYCTYKYIDFFKNKYKYTLQYRVPSHNIYIYDHFDYIVKKRGIIILMDFLRSKCVAIDSFQPKVKWSNYMKYTIPYYRLEQIRDRLGLVCINRLNLSFDTAHHSHAGVGLKCLPMLNIVKKFSSILVQITTAAYSKPHRRQVYNLFNILLIGGIGVVVWYKCVNHFNPTFLIPEPHQWFKHPATQVEGYKRVTFWMSGDPEHLHEIVKKALLYEQPFNDIIKLNQCWGWDGDEMEDKDRVTYIGLAIMISTFLTTGILKTSMPMQA